MAKVHYPGLASHPGHVIAAKQQRGFGASFWRPLGAQREVAERCEQLLQQILDVKRALLTTSCTDALEMSGVLLNLEPGDEVIVPSFTFVSTINAYVLRGAKPASEVAP